MSIAKNKQLYVCIGGAGTGTGYNGGTPAYSNGGAGGGCTHIAQTNKRGILKNYASNKGEVLIVAGGGGGVDNTTNQGGHGGGQSGGNGDGTTGGSQTAGGSGAGAGSFGQGGFSYSSVDRGAAGGGGWYGGGGTVLSGGAAGGGSGYLNASYLISGTTSWSNGVRSGDGYATITLTRW